MKDLLFTLLAWLLTLPFIIGSVAFALYNQAAVPVSISPFQEPLPMPVYLPVLGALAIGFLFGAVMTWAAMGRIRGQKRNLLKKVKMLEKQLGTKSRNHPVRHDYAVTPLALLEQRRS